MSHENITPSTLQDWIAEGSVRLIDVREQDEFRRVHIEGAECQPLSGFDPRNVAAPADGERLVTICRTGRRSGSAAEQLHDAGAARVFNLQGGMAAWQSKHLPVAVDRSALISLTRQVQITVGTMVLATTILGVTVSPWFLLLTGFAGAGLIFAGVTDTCAMAMALSRMPWNRRATCAKPNETLQVH
jgi:rhodanese-related sulfurtransferase